MLKRLSQASKKTQGFSLVELIVVIALLGMLMLLMVSNYGKFFSSSKEKIAKMLLENL
ncbi:MAG: prepilin-type N-terminal cleavage/methylation domain-containing protein [Opitutales bacterium]|nr:prepilin-type N-terminal cleavage/methylation domain-containing protein [Opitutales bacterium]